MPIVRDGVKLMNRIIKFRAWDNEQKKMLYACKVESDGSVLVCTSEGFTRQYDPSFKKLTDVMQFTGLHDTHGKEIYEGDVVTNNISCGLSVIEFSEGRFILAHVGKETCDELFYLHRDAYATVTVIGDKFEDPELLEEQK